MKRFKQREGQSVRVRSACVRVGGVAAPPRCCSVRVAAHMPTCNAEISRLRANCAVFWVTIHAARAGTCIALCPGRRRGRPPAGENLQHRSEKKCYLFSDFESPTRAPTHHCHHCITISHHARARYALMLACTVCMPPMVWPGGKRSVPTLISSPTRTGK